jgi:membrane fusion protein, epimerase transport system
MTSAEREFKAGPVIRSGLFILVAGVVSLGAWAIIAPLSGAVIAPGFVKIDLNRKVVQHQEGGIVSAIRVRDGERVKMGQELIVLDDVRVDAQFDLLRTQVDAERAKAARLEAERAVAAHVIFPRDIADRQSDPKINELIQRERTLFRARRDAVDSQIAVLRKQIRETTDEAAALSAQLRPCQRSCRPRSGHSSCRRRSSLPTSGCSSRATCRKRAS